MPGAIVKLAGTYALNAEVIDFKGELLLDAKISQTVTGFKSLLLKVVDPLFNRRTAAAAPSRSRSTASAATRRSASTCTASFRRERIVP